MAKHSVEEIRNIALCGHLSSGKTTLVDHILRKTGAITRPASVDDGTSVSDFDEEEKRHKYSVDSSLVHFTHAGKHFNLIDTPGYPDFIGQAIGALRGVETAVIAINAHTGIGVNTRRVFKEAGDAGLGRIIVITKLDSENIDFVHLLDDIREAFGSHCVPLNVPIGVSHDFKGVASTLHLAPAPGAIIPPESIHKTLIEAIVEFYKGAREP